MEKLFLYEEIMLLALRDEEGTIVSGSMYGFGLAGAIVAELLLQHRITVEENKRRRVVNVVDTTMLGDPLLDECLLKMQSAKRRATLSTWISRFSGIRKLKHRVALQLCQRGILRAEEDKILLIFTRKIYPEVDPQPENEIKERLREAIFTEDMDINSRTLVLVSLANSTSLLNANFDKKALKERKQRIKAITAGEVTGKATAEAIQAMQAAVMVATIVPVIAAASSAS
ncbi:MAG: GPP34 family phosphoprotein [Deferribacteres bacterium]|nr:GPP34 family phosphoprotein [Deferribacteres bacterium]